MLHAAAVVAIAVAVAAVIAIMHKLNSHANLKKLASAFYANSFAMCVDFGGGGLRVRGTVQSALVALIV